MQYFEDIALQKFKQEMLTHARAFAPQLSQALDEQQLNSAVEQAMQRAAQCAFTYRGPIRLYVEMMLLFGSDFHNDPQYPQFQAYLHFNSNVEAGDDQDEDADEDDQILRAEELYDLIIDYQAQVAAFDSARVYHVLQNMPALSAQAMQRSSSEFITGMLAALQYAHPQKAEYVGADALLQLIMHATHIAQQQNLTRRSEAQLVLLMYCFGHGCLNDPLYPWIAQSLYENTIDDATTRLQSQQHTLGGLHYLLQQGLGA